MCDWPPGGRLKYHRIKPAVTPQTLTSNLQQTGFHSNFYIPPFLHLILLFLNAVRPYLCVCLCMFVCARRCSKKTIRRVFLVITFSRSETSQIFTLTDIAAPITTSISRAHVLILLAWLQNATRILGSVCEPGCGYVSGQTEAGPAINRRKDHSSQEGTGCQDLKPADGSHEGEIWHSAGKSKKTKIMKWILWPM